MSSMNIEIDDTLVVGYSKLDEGMIFKLKHNISIFIARGRMGIFDNAILDSFSGDISKIPTLKIILQAEEKEIEYNEILNTVQ